MKAQVSAISMILIVGIVISLVGSSYIWGKPLIDKRTTITQFTVALRFMEDLDEKIKHVASSCTTAGACEVKLDIPTSGDISVNSLDNSISYTFYVEQPLFRESDIPYNTGNVDPVANYGELPGVITVSGDVEEWTNSITLKLKYRELVDIEQGKGFYINLTGDDIGENSVIIRFEGIEIKPGEASNGGDLYSSKIAVETL